MKLTVLGASGTYGSPGEACSGYLVQAAGVTVLLDAGAGTLAELQRHIDIRDLDAVLVSHSHPDHWVELPIMRNALRYVLGSEGLPLYTTAETHSMLEMVSGARVEPTFVPHVLTDSAEIHIGGVRARFSRTDHPPETLAMEIHDGSHSLVYSSDTGPGWSVGEFGAGHDLVVCEATLRDGHVDTTLGPPVHMTAAEAGATAAAAGARRLMITHLLPGADVAGAVAEAEGTYGAHVDVARSGVTVELTA